jgi:TRAP-type C4-dicarboxylate transport system substrate-binding protein
LARAQKGRNLVTRKGWLGSAAATLMALSPSAPSAQETVLSAVGFLPNDSEFGKPFVEFASRINREGAGLVRLDIRLAGSIPVFEMGNALKTGVLHFGFTAATFYQNLLPIGDAIKLRTRTTEEIHKNGGWDFFNQLHNERANMWHLSTWGDNVPFHIYTRDKKVEKADFTGLRIRVSPVYRALVQALGGTIAVIPPPELQPALERGVVDGFGWPLWDLKGLGVERYTKFRIDPGFYQTSQSFVLNLDKWRALPKAAQDLMTREAMAFEVKFARDAAAQNARYEDEQRRAGITVVTLSGAEAERYRRAAYDAGWEEAAKLDAVNAPKLRKLISKE